MSRAACAVLGSLLLLSVPASAQDGAQPTLTLHSRVFENTRSIRVLLPPGYDAPENRARRYPVFYFTDGIAAWEAWGVPAIVQDLWERGVIPPFVFVGIDNGGSTRESTSPVADRAGEYLPYPDQTWLEAPPRTQGDRFPRFLFEEVAPLVEAAFRTTASGPCTGLAGASYGAAVALYTTMQQPDRLGFLLLESPSLHIGNGRLLRDAAATDRWPGRISLGVGTAEGDTREARDRMLTDARALGAVLERGRQRPVVYFREHEGATHWYDAWRERLPGALTFLLSGEDGARCAGSAPSADLYALIYGAFKDYRGWAEGRNVGTRQ